MKRVLFATRPDFSGLDEEERQPHRCLVDRSRRPRSHRIVAGHPHGRAEGLQTLVEELQSREAKAA
jgi:hypothetical protein